MNIDSDKIEALYELSLNKTFSKAAESLGISQPALSKKIVRLEDELESSLVVRGSKGISLTQAGIEIIRYHKLKRELDLELLNKLSLADGREFIGEVNIAVYSSIGRSVILPCLSPLVLEYPGIKVNFLIKEERDLEETLLSGEASFVVSNFQISRENIVSDKIGEEEIIHITPNSKSYPEYFLDHDKYDQTSINFLKYQSQNYKIKRNFFADIYAIIDAVGFGYGQAVVSKHLVKKNKLIKEKKYNKKMISPIFLSYYHRSYIPKVHSKVIEALSHHVKQFL